MGSSNLMDWPTSSSACRIEPSSTCNLFDAVILEMINQKQSNLFIWAKHLWKTPWWKGLAEVFCKTFAGGWTNETKCIVHHLQENTEINQFWNMLNSSLRSKENRLIKSNENTNLASTTTYHYHHGPVTKFVTRSHGVPTALHWWLGAYDEAIDEESLIQIWRTCCQFHHQRQEAVHINPKRLDWLWLSGYGYLVYMLVMNVNTPSLVRIVRIHP